jgi:hypothetical protein
MLDVLVGVTHDDAYSTADTQVDLGLAGLPVAFGLPPAPHHFLAGPRIEDRVGGCLVCALDPQCVIAVHFLGSLRRRTRSDTQAFTTSNPVLVPASVGNISSTGTPAM